MNKKNFTHYFLRSVPSKYFPEGLQVLSAAAEEYYINLNTHRNPLEGATNIMRNKTLEF